MTITTENIPLELRQRRQWVTWKPKSDGGKDFSGRYNNQPSTWLSFEQVQNEPYIAYVLSDDDPYFGIDLDDCLVDGKLSPPAQHIVDMFAGVGYIEISSSGCGIKITLRGSKPSGITRSRYTIDGQEIEVYSQKRFWCMTGSPLSANQPTNLVDATTQIEEFAKWVVKPAELLPQQLPQRVPQRVATRTVSSSTDFLVQRAEAYLSKIPDPREGNRNNTIYEAAGELLVIANDDGEVLSQETVTDLLHRRFGSDSELTREYIFQRVQAAGKDNPRPLKLPRQEEIPDFSHLYKKATTTSALTKEDRQICRSSDEGYKLSPFAFATISFAVDNGDIIHHYTTIVEEEEKSQSLEPKKKEEAGQHGICRLDDFISSNPDLREIVVDGLLRVGETCNFIAASKAGKTFLAVGLALSVALGRKWLGRETKQGRVLIIDNELHTETLSHRIKTVADAMEVSVEELGPNVDVLSLRGQLISLPNMRRVFDSIKAGTYQVVILDALYRMLPEGTSESDNAQVTALYNLLDGYAAQLNASFIVVHHSSKGEQGGKSVTDIGSGAGAISRAADAHITVRPHEHDGLAVLEARVRSFRSPDPQTIQFDWPLWSAVDDVEAVVRDPAAKQRQARTDARKSQKQNEDRKDVDFLLSIIPQKGIGKTDLRSKSGWGNGKFERILGLAQSQWPVVEVKKFKSKGKAKLNFRVFRTHLTVDAYLGNQVPIEKRNPNFQK